VCAAVAEALPHLLECEKLLGDKCLRQMWQNMKKDFFSVMKIKYKVPYELFSSLGKCIETLDRSCLTGDELRELTNILDQHLNKHFEQCDEQQKQRRDEDFDEEVEEELNED
ncbi:unnamed protein product, partial [Didymodactylos carnosus]